MIAQFDHLTLASGQKDVKRVSDQLIYIQITRGVALRDHVMPADLEPTVFVMSSAMKSPTAAQRENGVACVTADDFRWKKAHIKTVSLLGAVFSRQIRADAGVVETVLAADELLLTSATKEVLAITTLDDQPVGNGKPGPICARLLAAYQRAKEASPA